MKLKKYIVHVPVKITLVYEIEATSDDDAIFNVHKGQGNQLEEYVGWPKEKRKGIFYEAEKAQAFLSES